MRNYLEKRNNELNFFDGVFDDFFKPMFFDVGIKNMRTDIKNTDNGFELEIEMPGVNKEDVNLSLENGYLTVSVNKKEESNEKYVRRERLTKSSRSYYVGDVDEDKIKASLNNGILLISFPKQEEQRRGKNIKID